MIQLSVVVNCIAYVIASHFQKNFLTEKFIAQKQISKPKISLPVFAFAYLTLSCFISGSVNNTFKVHRVLCFKEKKGTFRDKTSSIFFA